jgi:hypothetical protein
MKDFNSIRQSLLKEATENPKAFATASVVGVAGSAASIAYATTLTTTSIVNGAVITAKASVVAKAVVGVALLGATIYGSYKLYGYLKPKMK